MMYLAKWFLKTGIVMVVLGGGLISLKRARFRSNIPGDKVFALGDHVYQLPLGTGVLLILLVTLYLNTMGRPR